ncbi:MAG: aspartate/glutamate racemase family protein [Candidatus Hodarchaeota archaeon]
MKIAKLGILVPSANRIMEPDLYRMGPEGVTFHFARVRATKDTKEEIAGMIDYVENPTELLTHAGVDIIAFGCTAGSFIGGPGYDEKIIQKIERVAKIPVTTTTTAFVEALKEMNVRKLTLATPYEDYVNRREVEFLEDKGFSVLSEGGLGLIEADVQSSYPPEKIKQFIKKLDTPETDGIFISCTNFRGVEVIKDLEADLNKPVVTSNQATLWKMLRMVEIQTPISNYGQLLETL